MRGDIIVMAVYTKACVCVCFFSVQCGANTQLLHVFQEDFILGYKPQDDLSDINTAGFPSADGAQLFLLLIFLSITPPLCSNSCSPLTEFHPPPFSEKFFLVVIEKDECRNSVLQMWHLHLKSVHACVGE